MVLSVAEIYSVRFGAKLALPKAVQDCIGRLRITPAPYKPVRIFANHRHRPRRNNPNTTEQPNQDWAILRRDMLADYVRKIKQQDDKEYAEIFRIFNKVAPSNVEQLSAEAINLMEKRDDDFRLRVSILLFNRAITNPAFSNVMAECARFLNMVIPEISEDLQTQIELFPRLYDMNDTIIFPEASDENFDDKVVAWVKQKEKRRGYAKFMMELFSKELIEQDTVKQSLDQVVIELNEVAKQSKTSQTEENTTQFVEFVFETSKIVKGELKESLKKSVQAIFAVPKDQFKTTYPSMNMKSKFKLEDALKLLEKEE